MLDQYLTVTRRRNKVGKGKSGVLALLANQNSKRTSFWQDYVCGWGEGGWSIELLRLRKWAPKWESVSLPKPNFLNVL